MGYGRQLTLGKDRQPLFNFDFNDLLYRFMFRIPAIVISLTAHEFSHAFSAYQLGDNTARNMGRMTLNPVRHLDPIGFLCLCIMDFGWAKPVPVNPYRFRFVDGKTGMLLTALAGPMSNILLCFICVGFLTFLPARLLFSFSWLYVFLTYMVWINASLAFFNLIPVPPLDGSKILFGILPDSMDRFSYILDQYGFIFLIILLAGRIPDMILGPLCGGLINTFVRFFGLFG